MLLCIHSLFIVHSWIHISINTAFTLHSWIHIKVLKFDIHTSSFQIAFNPLSMDIGMDENFMVANLKYYNKAFHYHMRKEGKDRNSIEDRLSIYALLVKNYVGADFQNFQPAMKLNGFQRRINGKTVQKVQTMSQDERDRLHHEAKQLLLKAHEIRSKRPLDWTVIKHFLREISLVMYNIPLHFSPWSRYSWRFIQFLWCRTTRRTDWKSSSASAALTNWSRVHLAFMWVLTLIVFLSNMLDIFIDAHCPVQSLPRISQGGISKSRHEFEGQHVQNISWVLPTEDERWGQQIQQIRHDLGLPI